MNEKYINQERKKKRKRKNEENDARLENGVKSSSSVLVSSQSRRTTLRGRDPRFNLAILYSLPKPVTQVASHEKYYCASSSLKKKRIIRIIIINEQRTLLRVHRCKAYFLCMLFLYASRKRTRLNKG